MLLPTGFKPNEMLTKVTKAKFGEKLGEKCFFLPQYTNKV